VGAQRPELDAEFIRVQLEKLRVGLPTTVAPPWSG
jgi:hypothetical protein